MSIQTLRSEMWLLGFFLVTCCTFWPQVKFHVNAHLNAEDQQTDKTFVFMVVVMLTDHHLIKCIWLATRNVKLCQWILQMFWLDCRYYHSLFSDICSPRTCSTTHMIHLFLRIVFIWKLFWAVAIRFLRHVILCQPYHPERYVIGQLWSWRAFSAWLEEQVFPEAWLQGQERAQNVTSSLKKHT